MDGLRCATDLARLGGCRDGSASARLSARPTPRRSMDLAATQKPYDFIGVGAMDATKPNEFISFGGMDATKPYEFIGFGECRS